MCPSVGYRDTFMVGRNNLAFSQMHLIVPKADTNTVIKHTLLWLALMIETQMS